MKFSDFVSMNSMFQVEKRTYNTATYNKAGEFEDFKRVPNSLEFYSIDTYECKKCKKLSYKEMQKTIFRTKEELIKHLEFHYFAINFLNLAVIKSNKYFCVLCNCVYESEEDFINHLTERFSC